MDIKFEIKDKDYLGRIGVLKIGNKKLQTPYLFPVVHPIRQEISLKDMARVYDLRGIITNSYILYKNNSKIQDIHKFLNFDGIIMTDSGAFQWMQYKDIDITQKEIVLFEEKIKADIKVPLDKPSLARDYDKIKKDLEITLKNMREFIELRREYNLNPAWVYPVQGKYYIDLLRKSGEFGKKYKDFFEIFAIGSVVPEMDEYIFEKLVINIFYGKYYSPIEKPIHAFGVGHPIVIPLLVFLGMDLFDSASYILFAKDFRIMTEFGSKKLDNLEYLPIYSPLNKKYTIEDLKELKKENPNECIKLIALHNLYTIYRIIQLTKEAIREGKLFNLVATIVRSHPNLLNSFYYLLKNIKEFKELAKKLDPIRKRSGYFYLEPDSKYDPHMERALERVKERLGKLKSSLFYVYPFGQIVGKKIEFEEFVVKEKDIIKDILNYQFGDKFGDFFLNKIGEFKILKSKTGRLKQVVKDNKVLLTIRASDGYVSLTIEGAKMALEFFKSKKRYYIMIDSKFIKEIKGDILKYMIIDFDKNLLPREEVVVVDENWNLIGVGEVRLSSYEIENINYGSVVKLRKKV